MARSTFFLLALVGVVGLVSCQFGGRDDFGRERERERERERVPSRRLAEGCTGKVMDVFFLMDSSSSIYINDYMSQHRLVRDIISKFDISNEATRVGMLTFSDDLERPVISLNQYSGKNELLSSISTQNLPYRTGVTNTDLAIRYVRQLNDFRQDITKVMVIMTDGGSRSPGSTAREAELARNAGFYMFVVGIGQYLEEREWRSIASDPDTSFVYNITTPRFLEDVQFSLPPRACALPPIILGGSCDVSRMSEIYFVAGRSAQNYAMDFLESFGRRTRDQGDLLRVNFLIDGCAPITDMQLINEEPFLCERYDRLGNAISPRGASEMFADAARAVSESRSRDLNSNHVIVLFADEETMSSDRFELSSESRRLTNIQNPPTVVVADMGIRAYRDFALRMSSGRDNFISFIPGGVSGNSNAQRNLLDSVCNAANFYLDGSDFSGSVV